MIAVGVDTHKHWHVAVALDALGQVLGEIVIAATAAGYGELVAWLSGLDGEVVVGIQGAGSYGAALCQHLREAAVAVVEVERPRRRDRRAGKSDHIDTLLAAKRVLAGDGLSTPRAAGSRTALSVLLVAYRSCVKERTRLLNHKAALAPACPQSSGQWHMGDAPIDPIPPPHRASRLSKRIRDGWYTLVPFGVCGTTRGFFPSHAGGCRGAGRPLLVPAKDRRWFGQLGGITQTPLYPP